MKVKIDRDACMTDFISEDPSAYGYEVDVPDALVAEYREVMPRFNELQNKLTDIYDDVRSRRKRTA